MAAGWKASKFIRRWKAVCSLTLTVYGLVGINVDGTICVQDVESDNKPGSMEGREGLLSWDSIVDVVAGSG